MLAKAQLKLVRSAIKTPNFFNKYLDKVMVFTSRLRMTNHV